MSRDGGRHRMLAYQRLDPRFAKDIGLAPADLIAASRPRAERPPQWAVLLVLLTGTFMIVLDFYIVNVAIPSMQRDLRANAAEIEFVVAAYALAAGSGLIVGGRLGDVFGRRRMFALGLMLFTASSAACGAAPSQAALLIARIAQGLSAALMSPQVLAIVGATYSGVARERAFNAYGMTMGIAATFGQLIGGLLVRSDLFGWGWRTCFFVNLPIGIASIILLPRVVAESRAGGRPRLDLAGAILVSSAMFAVVFALIEGRQRGWPPWAFLCFVSSIPLFALFVLYERRLSKRGGAPLVDLRLFRERTFTMGLIAQLAFYGGIASFFLAFAIYAQNGRGLDPYRAGLLFVPVGVGYLTTSTVARVLAARLGRQIVAAGALVKGAGLGLLALTVTHIGVNGNAASLIPGLFLDGAGTGLVLAPLASIVLARIPPQHAGAAAGVLATGVQIGGALGVAIVGVIFYGALGRALTPAAFARAFELSLLALCSVGPIVAGLAQLLPPASRRDRASTRAVDGKARKS